MNKTINPADTLTLDIPFRFGKKPISTNGIFVEFNGKKLYLEDITKITYAALKSNVNLIPIFQYFKFSVRTETENISFEFISLLYIGYKKNKNIYLQLIAFSKQFIEPTLIKKFISQIFEKSEKVKIGRLELSKEGYSYSKILGGRAMVHWQENIHAPINAMGYIFLYKEKDGKAGKFASISQFAPNAGLLPELIILCKEYFSSHKDKMQPLSW